MHFVIDLVHLRRKTFFLLSSS